MDVVRYAANSASDETPLSVNENGSIACAKAGKKKSHTKKSCVMKAWESRSRFALPLKHNKKQFQRRYWNPHWIRVAEEDEAMKIGPWVATKRKAFWEARFAVAVANCNASMISRSQHITV